MDFIGVTGQYLTLLFEGEYGFLFKLLFLSLLIALYSVFIFYFYKFLAKKNLIELNLHQYNTASEGFFVRVIPMVLYVIEYIVILPIVTFFWFTVLSALLFLLSQEISLDMVLLISAALVAAVRTTSYINENLSQDLAKMLPFTLLGVALTKPSFFVLSTHISRINEFSAVAGQIVFYLGFIIVIEFVMRMYDLFRSVGDATNAMKGPDDDEDD